LVDHGGLPPPISTTERRLRVDFASDDSVAANGFRLEWIVNGCGGYLRGKTSGRMATPNYPGTYPLNVECTWVVETEPGSKIRLNITDFDFEASTG